MKSMTPEERFERIETQLEQLSASVARHDTQIIRLTDVVLSLAHVVEEQGRRMDEGFARLTEAQRRTDERLNALINVVERYFSNGRQ